MSFCHIFIFNKNYFKVVIMQNFIENKNMTERQWDKNYIEFYTSPTLLLHVRFIKGGSRTGFVGFVFCKLWMHNTHTSSVVKIKCVQYVFYSLPSLQKQGVCLKCQQNNPQPPKIFFFSPTPPPPPLHPGFEIPGSATVHYRVTIRVTAEL